MKKQDKNEKPINSKKELEELTDLDKELEDLINTNEIINDSIKKIFNEIKKEKKNGKSN